jgi:hypothetical protein
LTLGKVVTQPRGDSLRRIERRDANTTERQRYLPRWMPPLPRTSACSSRTKARRNPSASQ